MSQNIEDRRVGIIEVPDLVPVLTDAGYEVVTGDTVADAVAAIQGAFSSGSFPIVVADSNTQGLDKWITAVASMDGGPDVSVLSANENAEHIIHDNIMAVPMPFTLSELAEEAALAPVDQQWAEVSWPEDDQETEIEQEQAPVPALPDLPAFDGQSAQDSPQQQYSAPGDTSTQEPVDDVWDATAAHRQRLAQQREQHQPTEPVTAQPAYDPHAQPPMPDQPVDYRGEPQEDDVYANGLNPEPPPPVVPRPAQRPSADQFQPPASPVSQPPRRPNRRTQSPTPPPAQPQQPQQPVQKRPVEYGQRGIRKARVRTRQAPMIFVSGAKGGIGKTTFARQLAITSAAHGYRTVLIDGDLGQANVPKFLKMDTRGYKVPTISDFALGDASLEEVVITSDVIDELRPDNATPVPDKLSVVLAPGSDDLDVNSVTAQHYIQVIADVRERFDMVIFDSQIMKTTDEFKLTGSVIIPEVRDNGAFFLGLADDSTSALEDLVDRIAVMVQQDIDRRRILVAMNNVTPLRAATRRIDEKLQKMIHGRIGVYVGIINNDQQVWSRMIAGEPDLNNRQIDQVVYRALFRATGYEKFDQQFDTDTLAPDEKEVAEKKPSLFSRLFGRG
ncbi:MAG: AAA family ATPase [Micrococcaceae bacterium]|nr:AAA family ATPase [Micrococcaceae bacterium]